MTPSSIPSNAAQAMRIWLVLIGLLVYAMILIGGATRLTDSGLSITEWAPIKGILPPVGPEAWASEFGKYRQTAEFQQQNYNMTLAEFQFIYWWEWGHRLFGRLIGLVAIIGFGFFALKGWLNRIWLIRLVILIGLGALQGLIGWWMVASGIGETTRLDVAPYRLMTHFGLALLIITLTSWYWMELGSRPARNPAVASGGAPFWPAALLLTLVALQMLTGALVAGLDAGRSYTDWPLMAGELIPGHYLQTDLGLRSLFEGRAATQFNHRFLAYGLFVAAFLIAVWQRRGPLARSFAGVAALVTAQAVLGIVTLVYAAPLQLALMHQGLGVIVLLASVRLVWRASCLNAAPLAAGTGSEGSGQ
jgi:cytochrome c oxidase assembly protein subunit 15